jgi:hypothetical protein
MLALCLALGCGGAAMDGPQRAAAPRRLEPSPPPGGEAALRPGLAVTYYPGFAERHLDLLPEKDSPFATRGVPGEPVLHLNQRFGNGPVFGSGRNTMVGMRMVGWLHCEAAGIYRFQALSNDGLRVTLGNLRILDDPLQHGDQLTEVAEVALPQPGWYPLRVEYFQRKGTAVLEFHWQPPGAAGLSPVPAEALAHLP